MKLIRLGLAAVLLTGALSLGESREGTSQPRPPVAPEDFPKAWRICPEGPPTCDFATISEAIRAASPNDFLRIRPGTYQENLVIDKSVQLAATEEGQVRIQGTQPGKPTITLHSQGDLRVALEGVIILGGPQQACFNQAQEICPDGVTVSGEGSVVLSLVNSQILQAFVGIRCPRSLHSQGSLQIILLNSRLAENSEGIMFYHCDFQAINLRIKQSTFAGNEVDGILIIDAKARESSSVMVEIEASRFVANKGGLIVSLLGNSKLTVYDSWFLNNMIGAGVAASVGSTAEIRNSYFIGNQFGLMPAAWDGLVLLEDSVLSGNSEAGLYVRSEGQIEARHNLIEDNGWGVYVVHAKKFLWFEDNRVYRNREWGLALARFPCVEHPPPPDPRVLMLSQIFIQGENNEIRDNGKGNLCPEDYNWPPDFIKQP